MKSTVVSQRKIDISLYGELMVVAVVKHFALSRHSGIRDGRGYSGKALTQREIAKELRFSHNHISRIEKKALEKLRKRFEEGESCNFGVMETP